VTVLIYQYGGGLCNFLTPTNGGLMAILAAAKVPYGKWIRFLAPIYAGLVLLGLFDPRHQQTGTMNAREMAAG
jgi:uncharacterized ion transporter superfamily protein YfcC